MVQGLQVVQVLILFFSNGIDINFIQFIFIALSRMKKSYIFAKKEGVKRSNTLPKPNFINKPLILVPQTYKYFVGTGNNAHLIRRILSTRTQWQQLSDSKNILISFKWQQSNRGYIYECSTAKRPFRQLLNHLEYHQELSNKEYLFKNMVEYCQLNKMNAFQYLPLTFVINTLDSCFQSQQTLFLNFYHQLSPPPVGAKPRTSLQLIKRPIISGSITFQKKIQYINSKYQLRQQFGSPSLKALWILKPTFQNRGNGIHVFGNLTQLQSLMSKYMRGTPEQPGLVQKIDVYQKKSIFSSSTAIIQSTSFVIQKYMERPLLFNGRKFDIRMWVMITQQMKVYMFRQGYIRTSSLPYSLDSQKINDLGVHLTNNAIQKDNPEYNKYQKGNQLPLKALKGMLEDRGRDFDQFIDRVKELIKISIMAVRRRINRMDRDNCFQIFGYDFMVDDVNCRPWLIEVNTNPCLQQSSPLLQQLLPRMLDDAFSLTLDKIFPSPKTAYSYVVQNEINSDNLWDSLLDLRAL